MSKTAVHVDMSPKAIDRRLRNLSQLYEFGLTLKDVRWLGKVEDLKTKPRKPAPAAKGR